MQMAKRKKWCLHSLCKGKNKNFNACGASAHIYQRWNLVAVMKRSIVWWKLLRNAWYLPVLLRKGASVVHYRSINTIVVERLACAPMTSACSMSAVLLGPLINVPKP